MSPSAETLQESIGVQTRCSRSNWVNRLPSASSKNRNPPTTRNLPDSLSRNSTERPLPSEKFRLSSRDSPSWLEGRLPDQLSGCFDRGFLMIFNPPTNRFRFPPSALLRLLTASGQARKSEVCVI